MPQIFLPAALSHFATEGRFGAAFDFGRISDVVTSRTYFGAWLAPTVVYTVMFVVDLILAITIFGLVPWVTFYGSVAIFRMFGQAYVTAVERKGQIESATGPATEPTVN